ncbi:MAG: right-handed parallel beta-helix repeat-containing protein, partial [Acidobacteriales bacterium]|nr:right-handed parallel beta-helix repeat-containing protein [Terriglobales bacterium]
MMCLRSIFRTIAILAVCSVLLLVEAVQAATWFVDANGPSTGQTGTNWDHPYLTIQQVMSNLSLASGDVILVAGGTYKPANQDTPIPVSVPSADIFSLNIKGGYAGHSGLPNGADVRNETSILSGELGSPALDSDDAFTVVLIPEGTQPPSQTGAFENRANLDGFEITGAYDDVNGANADGGGILAEFASPVATLAIIRDCDIHHNHTFDGGGVYVAEGCEVILRKCDIHHNDVDGEGGGIAAAGAVRVVNCLIRENTSDGDGAGIKLLQGTSAVTTVVNSTIKANVGGSGAGISMKSSNPT